MQERPESVWQIKTINQCKKYARGATNP
jgi:hypothetical protein